MNVLGYALFKDPVGFLLGHWRRVLGRAAGELDYRNDAMGLVLLKQARKVQHMPSHLDDLIRENPRRSEALTVLAHVQLNAKDWEAAMATGQVLKRQFPAIFDGYRVVAMALRGAGQHDEAETVTLAAMLRFPRSTHIALQYAQCAQARGDLVEALRRSTEAAQRFPNDMRLHFLCTRLAIIGKCAKQAADMAAYNVHHWPDEWDAWLPYVELAEARCDWQTATAGSRQMLARFPARPESYWRGAKILRMAGDTVAAGAIIDTGMFIFPRNPQILQERSSVIAASAVATPIRT